MLARGWSVFGKRRSRNIIFSREVQANPTKCGWSLFLPEVRLMRGVVKARRHMVVGAGGMNGCQGTPWSEELDGKELHGAAGGDLEP